MKKKKERHKSMSKPFHEIYNPQHESKFQQSVPTLIREYTVDITKALLFNCIYIFESVKNIDMRKKKNTKKDDISYPTMMIKLFEFKELPILHAISNCSQISTL